MRALLIVSAVECQLVARASRSADMAWWTFQANEHAAQLSGALHAACAHAATELRASSIRIVLMPDVCEVRRVSTPPLSSRDAERFVCAQSSAIFLQRGALRCAVTRMSYTGRDWLAAAAPMPVVEAVLTSADNAGIRTKFIAPAHECAVRLITSTSRSFSGVVEFAYYSDSSLLELVNGRLVGVRRKYRSAEADKAEVRNLSLDEVAGALLTARVRPSLNLSRRSAIRSKRFRPTMLLGTFTALAVTAALVVQQTSVELQQTRTDRARIASLVAIATVDRNALTEDAARAHLITQLRGAFRPVSEVIDVVTRNLPTDAYLTGLTVRGDTVELEGVTADTRVLYEYLISAGILQDLRVSRPVRRVAAADSSRLELFTLVGVR